MQPTPHRGAGAPSDEPALAPPHSHWTGLPAILTALGVVGTAGGGLWLAALRTAGQPPGPSSAHSAALTLLGIGLAALAGALAYYVLGPALRRGADPWEGVGSHRLVMACTLLVVLLSHLGPIVHGLLRPGQALCSVSGFMTAGLSVGAALLAVSYLRFIRPGVLTAADLGIRPGRLAGDVGTGLLLGIMALVLSAMVQALLGGLGVRQTQLQDLRCVRDFPLAGFFAILFAGGVLAPIAEELFFRGYVFRTYLRTRGPLVAYGLSSLLFATLHLNLPALLPILMLAVVFCWAYQRTGSIVPSMVAHALNNSVAFVILYFIGAPA